MSIEGDVVRLEFEVRRCIDLAESRHMAILDALGKIEIALALVVEQTTPREVTVEEVIEESAPEETEEVSEEESEGEIVEIETSSDEQVSEEVQEMLIDDAVDNLNGIPFGR
jgi:Mg/Co/Ni transporter MgtE